MSIKTFIFDMGVKASKHAPTALLIGGIVTGVAAAVIAVKRTPKLHEIITEDKEKLAKVKEMEDDLTAKFIVEQGETDDEPTLYAPYDHDVAEQDRNELARHMTASYVRTYAVPIGLAALSITMICLAYRMKCKALAAMTAAYNASVAAFKTYRKRAIDRYGADVDNDILLGRSREVVESTDEDGNMIVEEKTVINPISEDIVLRFDCNSAWHRNDPQHIRDFLAAQQSYLWSAYNSRSVKHLYLAELCDCLDISRDLRYSGKGWSEKIDPEMIELKLNLNNVTIEEEDGEYVGYIPLTIDGMIS